MSTTRRSFLGALLAVPVLWRLVPSLPAEPVSVASEDLDFDAFMRRDWLRFQKEQAEKYATSGFDRPNRWRIAGPEIGREQYVTLPGTPRMGSIR